MSDGQLPGNKRSCGKTIGKAIKNLDEYGQPISLTYKDEETYRSMFGGLLTVGTKCGLLIFFILQILRIINKEADIQTSSYI